MEQAETNKGIKIVLAEDDDFLRMILTKKLTKVGYEVFDFGDSTVVNQEIVKIRPQIILLDILMPDKNGFEIMEELKANPELSDIPVVVLSNLGQKEDVERSKSLGAVDFFTKSNFLPDEIVEKIGQILRDSQQG